VEINVTPTDKMPELTEGVPPFVVSDEEYEVDMDESKTSVFLESHSPEHGRAPQGWAHPFGEGRVVVIVPGHRMDTIVHPMINRLVQNALDWLTE
jgi:type 1 glutamine amidotransferase